MSDLTGLGACEISRLVRSGEVRATEVVNAFLDRADTINPALNAITDLQADLARKQAHDVDRQLLQRRASGSLCGVPVTIKSSIAAAGCRWECGTPLRQGQVADRDATVVRRMRRHGAVVIGSANVPEFLMAYETDNSLYGRTVSPIDHDFTPGGSSGGDAAAVAADCCAAGYGSDAGGSVRVPAHFCGLYGLKPTPGEVPRTGHWPPVGGPSTILAAVGPLAKTAEDLATLYRVTRGRDREDVSCIPRNYKFDRYEPSAIRDSKIGWFDHAWNTPVTRETRSAVRTAVKALEDLGYKTERIDLAGLERAPATWRMLFSVALKTLIEGFVPEAYRLHPLSYDAMASDREQAATRHEDLLNAWVAMDEMRYRLLKQLRKCPYIVCPVAAIPAFRHGERSWSVEGRRVTYPGIFVYSQVFNVLGAPAATVPVGKSRDGLPIGVQIVGKPFDDDNLMVIVEDLAKALGK